MYSLMLYSIPSRIRTIIHFNRRSISERILILWNYGTFGPFASELLKLLSNIETLLGYIHLTLYILCFTLVCYVRGVVF